MILVDTSIWIEFLRGSTPVSIQMSAVLERNEVLAVSPVFGELLQGACNKREFEIITGFWQCLPKTEEHEIFIRAGMIAGKNNWYNSGVGIIDAVIIVTARETSSFIWSLDKKLLRLLRNEEIFIP